MRPRNCCVEFSPSALGTDEAADLPRSAAKRPNAAEGSLASECDNGIKIESPKVARDGGPIDAHFCPLALFRLSNASRKRTGTMFARFLVSCSASTRSIARAYWMTC
jgi:hypothetical protein